MSQLAAPRGSVRRRVGAAAASSSSSTVGAPSSGSANINSSSATDNDSSGLTEAALAPMGVERIDSQLSRKRLNQAAMLEVSVGVAL